MITITRFLAVLTIAAGLTSSLAAHAGAIGHLIYDPTSSNPNIINRLTGVQYLNLSDAKDLNYAQTVAATSFGGIYEDYHIADQAEGFSFFNAMIPSTEQVLNNVGHPDNLRIDLGHPIADGELGDNFNDLVDLLFFLGDTQVVGLVEIQSGTERARINDSWGTINASDDLSNTGALSPTPASWLLVSNADRSQIPSPSPLALMALGLLGLGVIRRQSAKR